MPISKNELTKEMIERAMQRKALNSQKKKPKPIWQSWKTSNWMKRI